MMVLVMIVVLVTLFYCPVIDLSLDVIADLAQHPNIIGLKESGGDVSDCATILSIYAVHLTY